MMNNSTKRSELICDDSIWTNQKEKLISNPYFQHSYFSTLFNLDSYREDINFVYILTEKIFYIFAKIKSLIQKIKTLQDLFL